MPISLYLLLKAILFVGLALNTQYVMDEYTQACFSLQIPVGFYRSFDPIKTVLYAYVFDVARRLADNAVDFMRLARLEGAILALASAALTFGVSRRLNRTVLESLFVTAVLFSFSNFMERAFRVRSDTVAVFFFVLALWTALGGTRFFRAVASGLAAGAAFLSTQKAVYGVVALGLGYVAADASRRRIGESFRRAAGYGLGFGSALVAYAVWFGGSDFPRVLEMVFTSPLNFAPLGENPYYRGLAKYVWQTFERNPVPYALALTGLFGVIVTWKSRGPGVRLAAVTSLVVVALVFHHSQPWPYIFVMALPGLSIWATEPLRFVANRAGVKAIALIAVFFPLLALSLPRNLRYFERNNVLQNEVSGQAESLLGPGDRYFDAVGMVPTRHLAHFMSWEAMVLARVRRETLRGDLREFEAVFKGLPKLWILNYRVTAVWDSLWPVLSPSYVRVHPNIFLSGATLQGSSPVTFVNRWPGLYGLYGADGKRAFRPFVLDGVERTSDAMIPSGPHSVQAGGTNDGRALFLLPAGVSVPPPLREAASPYDLFGGVYE